MVTIDDMLVDALPPKVFQDFIDAVNAVQNGLRGENIIIRSSLKPTRDPERDTAA